MLFAVKSKIPMVFIVGCLLMHLGCQQERKVGHIAPDVSLRDLSGRMVTLEEFRGSVMLLDFWATWCPPCRMSIPELIRLQEKYGDKGLVILGISLDDPGLYSNKFLLAFKEMAKINYTILRYDQKVLKDYFGNESPAIPTMFLVDRQGKIRERFVGFRPGALEKSLNGFL
ncbi:MAG: TlpA family protein disulfide reductase [Deltaproteobacteria bacterium]|nr:TlpA family protein disulfide reductase [Deltaproteobacteria bacterium]